MSKELDALERLKITLLAEGYWQDVLQDIVVISKALKSLEVILENFPIKVFEIQGAYYLGLNYNIRGAIAITKEKYDLLSEVLK